MGIVWNNRCKIFGGNQSRDTGFQIKKLQAEVQTAVARKLIAGE